MTSNFHDINCDFCNFQIAISAIFLCHSRVEESLHFGQPIGRKSVLIGATVALCATVWTVIGRIEETVAICILLFNEYGNIWYVRAKKMYKVQLLFGKAVFYLKTIAFGATIYREAAAQGFGVAIKLYHIRDQNRHEYFLIYEIGI